MVDPKVSNKVVTLPIDKFTIIDESAEYIIKDNRLFVAIDLPNKLLDVVSDDNLSSSGKTYRVYSNSTNRKFIKNKNFSAMQIQINSYLSVKDASKLQN